MIRMRDICVSFRSERQEKIFGVSRTQVLFNVTLSIPKGSCLGILGESGSGKSTLGRVICGLLKPDSGEYLLEGKNVYASRDGKKNLQNMLSVVFQDYTTSANPRFRIRDILAEGIRVKDPKNGKKTDRSAEYCRLLELVGLDETFLDRFPHELSGGMLQRVLCAMSICCSPLWLLADEPTKGLDETACGVVYENLQKIKTSQSLGMLIITHDLQLARSICADIAVMYAGQIVEYGPQVLTGPRHPYTQAFLAALPENGFQPLPGLPPLPQDHLPGCRFAPRCPSCQKRCLQEVPPVYDSGTAKVRCFLYA